MTLYFTKESDSFANMAKDFLMLPLEHKQQLSGTTCQVAKIHARMIKIQQKNFVESIPNEHVNPGKNTDSNYKFRNFYNIENKLNVSKFIPNKTRMQKQ